MQLELGSPKPTYIPYCHAGPTGVPSKRVEALHRRSLFVCAVASLLIPAVMIVTAPPARAYGNTALWQIGLSFNCNNPSVCSELGGFWGWIEFDLGGTGDATLSGCAHLVSDTPPLSGAFAFQADFTWEIMSAAMPPFSVDHFWITGGMMTITGHTGGPPITFPIPDVPFDSGVPAMAGHYNTASIFGMTAPPGVAFQIQVVEIPNR